ncbi:hypothetical protein E0Z10_g5959 [Xylaria hypoxylon]|uniref:Uncharacterized protein n=1 Tax=Xylaria hypoxylon TaxID=37992 RepID=A0A4Z0YS05_9PEZI|nr:hypothetical protein E0Z10_g5959 [Xylaria hypoxylon]
MSSRNSSASYVNSSGSSGSSGYSTLVSQDTFRSHKSKNYQGERFERESHGSRSVTYNHNAGSYEKDAPTPSYGQSTTYGKSN